MADRAKIYYLISTKYTLFMLNCKMFNKHLVVLLLPICFSLIRGGQQLKQSNRSFFFFLTLASNQVA